MLESDRSLFWGDSWADYGSMFALTQEDFSKAIFDYQPSVGSFNAEMHEKGYKIISADSLFKLSLAKITIARKTALVELADRIKKKPENYVWKTFKSLDDLLAHKEMVIEKFLSDFLQGSQEDRYHINTLPSLPYYNYEFELALCSHNLFNQPFITVDDLLLAIKELCRVSHEVRIFPLLDCNGAISALLGPLILILQSHNFGVEVRQVNYELQKGGNAMLRIWTDECQI